MVGDGSNKRKRINRPYPTHTLESVLSIARTIQEVNAGLPMDRLLLADALGTTPSSSGFRMRLGSSEKYSLTHGAYNDERISLAPLGRSAVSPSSASELRETLRKAATAPEIFRRFYSLLAGNPLPEGVYAENVLTRELQVRAELARECLGIIKANGLYAGLLKESGDATLVEYDTVLDGLSPGPGDTSSADRVNQSTDGRDAAETSGRIFLGFSRALTAVDMLRETLKTLGLQPVDMAISPDGAAGPLSAEVSGLMKQCSAAVIFAASCDDDGSGATADRVDQASLILLGAASMLYGRRVVFVGPAAGEGPAGPPGTVAVGCHPGRPEATVLATLQALGDAGALRAAVPGS